MIKNTWIFAALAVLAWAGLPLAQVMAVSAGGVSWQEESAGTTAQQDDESEPDAAPTPDAEQDPDQDDAAEEELTEAAKELASLNQEFQQAMAAFMAEYTKAKPKDRGELIKNKLPQPAEYADRFMALAEKYPDDPAAFDALVWIVSRAPDSELAATAIDRLLEKHLNDDKMAEVAMELSFGMPGPRNEQALRLLIEQSDNERVKGAATLSLASYMMQLRRLAEFVKKDPEMKDRFDEELAQYMKDLKFDEDEVKALYQTVIDEYADVELRGRPLGERAESALFELEHLSIGKVAPDIEGEDFDGESFKLSDYRGKIVMLDFWGDW